MKTERRHELQKNDLADWLEKQAKNIGPLAKILVAALLAFFAIYFISGILRSRAKASAASSWDEFRAAASESDILGLREVAANYPGTEAAGWGLQTAGDLSLATGSMAMYGNRDVAMERLKEAREDFEGAQQVAKNALLKQRSLLGLAQANEALNDFDAAEQCYNKVISNWPDTAVAESAQSRLTFIKQPSTREFYDWFVKQEIDLPPPIPPLGGGSIRPPSVYGDLPSNPGLKLPGADDLGGDEPVGDDLTAPESSTAE